MIKKTLTISGTRTEAIETAPLWRALAAKPGAGSVVCPDGRHRELHDRSMPQRVQAEFDRKPNDGFAVMTKSRTLNSRDIRAIYVQMKCPVGLSILKGPGLIRFTVTRPVHQRF